MPEGPPSAPIFQCDFRRMLIPTGPKWGDDNKAEEIAVMNVAVCVMSLVIGVAFQAVPAVEADVNGAGFNPDISTWVSVSIPSNESVKELMDWKYSVNSSDIYWSLSVEGSNVLADIEGPEVVDLHWKCPGFSGPKGYYEERNPTDTDAGWPNSYGRHTRFFRVDDGWVVGFYNRFEGEVWWCSDEEKKSYKISDAKLAHLIEDKSEDAFYILDDTFDEEAIFSGRVHLVKMGESGEWYLDREVSIPARLEFGDQFGDVLFLVGKSSDLYVVDRNLSVEEKLSHEGWYISRPRDMVMVGKHLYIGAQQYVISVDTSS